jgi:hypothetical protein
MAVPPNRAFQECCHIRVAQRHPSWRISVHRSERWRAELHRLRLASRRLHVIDAPG